MNNNIYCYIAVAFAVADLYLMIVKKNDYEKSLDTNEEIQMYYKVKKERLIIYAIANIIAFMVIRNLIFMNIKSDNKLNTTCLYAGIYSIIIYFVYTIFPKKYWMLDTVSNKKDAQEWLKKYKYMKIQWHIGLILGIISYALYTYYKQ
jgi:uncharacterized membrane protein (GlpM family)